MLFDDGADHFGVMRVDAVPFQANSAYYDLRDDVPFLHLDSSGLRVTGCNRHSLMVDDGGKVGWLLPDRW